MKKRIAAFLAALLAIAYVVVPAKAALDTDEVDAIIASIPDTWPEAPEIAAESAILIDASSGEILYGKDATKRMFPASTTKLMTALLTLENASLTDVVSFSAKAIAIPAGSSHIGMRRGEQMLLKECLYGLLLPSANEVANALAEHVSGSISDFLVKMNERAYELGCVNTAFLNVNGLHLDGHYTCAYDLARIMMACAENSTFVEIAATQSYVHHKDELLPKDIPMTNTHMMLRPSSAYYNEYVVCGKTGHTEQSGYNLVTYAEKDGTRLIAVVLNCESGNQYVNTQSLLDYGFNYFRKVLPAELDTSLNIENMFTASPLEIPAEGATLLKLDSAASILLPDSVTFLDLEKRVEDTDDGKQILYTYRGYPLGAVSLSYATGEENSPVFLKQEPERLVPELPDNLNSVDGWLLILLAVMGAALFLILRALKKRYIQKGRSR